MTPVDVSTPVDVLYDEYSSIVTYLNENSQPSLSSDVNKYFKKVIVLSAASYFEHTIQELLVKFVIKKTNNDIPTLNFFKKKAIGMQYHTYFSWGEKNRADKPGTNANSFFSLFGEDFKKQAAEKIKQSDLKAAMEAFLEIGHLRNILVHSNFAAFNFDNKTTEEVVSLYQSGLSFVTFIEEMLLSEKHVQEAQQPDV